MVFTDRVDAGKKLADKLIEYKNYKPVVLALPRGGVPVGFEIAKKLEAFLDVLVVRKLGAPLNPEFGIGAIAPGGIKVLDQESIDYLGISAQDVDNIEKVEREELNRRIKKYRGSNDILKLKDRVVILVDDGLATGISARAAVKAVLEQHPQSLIVAMPVCALDAVDGIRSLVRPMKDEVVCLSTPYDFGAVGYWYKSFDQVSDVEVVGLLRMNRSLLKRVQEKDKTSKSFKGSDFTVRL